MIATVVSTIFTIWYVIGVCHKVTSKYTVCNECKYFQKFKFNLHVHVSIKLLEHFFYNNAIWSWNHHINHTNETRNTVSNAHKMIPPLPHVLYGKVLVLLWETPKSCGWTFKIGGAVWHHVVNNSWKFHEILFSGLRGVAD